MTETMDFGAMRDRDGMPLSFVLIVQKPSGPERHVIEGTVLLGSHAENDVVIDATGVSRYHLEVCAESNAVLIRDVGSKNGTFYNGARITEVRVGAGAVLRIGGPAGTEVNVELTQAPQIAPSDAQQFGPLVGSSASMRSVFTVLERTAPSTATILIAGETGTGKELVAQAVHGASPRKNGPFVVVDCGAIPHNLIESELFGHTKGAFTDAQSDRTGAFEQANGGTLFLDELGELPLELQPKLLRAVESRAIQRLGDSGRRDIDVRLIAATNRDLQTEVDAGRFRQDLFFRLAVVTVRLPPLRDRGRDVITLAKHILAQLGEPEAIEFDGPIAQALMSYAWPGNVRELRNALERAIHLGAEHAIPMAGPGGRPRRRMDPEDAPDLPFKEAKEQLVMSFERAYVERLMARHGGNISGAARHAGIDRNYLYRLLKKHDLEK